MTIHLRKLTEEEKLILNNIVYPYQTGDRYSKRADIVLLASRGRTVPQIAKQLKTRQETVRFWLKRFDIQGLPGLEDAPRLGAPSRCTPRIRKRLIDIALTPPEKLDLPFIGWSYKRLADYLQEELGLKISKTRVCEILHEELILPYPNIFDRGKLGSLQASLLKARRKE